MKNYQTLTDDEIFPNRNQAKNWLRKEGFVEDEDGFFVLFPWKADVTEYEFAGGGAIVSILYEGDE